MPERRARWFGCLLVLACFGVGLPVLMLIAEGKSLRGDKVWRMGARPYCVTVTVIFSPESSPST